MATSVHYTQDWGEPLLFIFKEHSYLLYLDYFVTI